MRCINILTLLAASAIASPILERQSAPPDPGTPCLYLTTEPNWGGAAENICKPGGTCVDISTNLAGQVSSGGPDEGVKCFFYAESGCKGEMSSAITYPGNANFQTVATVDTNHFSNFDNRAMSFMCSKGQNQESSPVARREVDSTAIATREVNPFSEIAESSTDPCLYLTVQSDWKGASQKLCLPSATCVNLEPSFSFVGSAGPDGGSTCYLYESRGCVGDHSKGIRYPGVSNGTNIWSKYTHSYICFKDDGVARRDVDTLPAPSDAATSINLNTVSDTSDSSTDPCIYFTSEINWRGVGEKFCVPNISCVNLNEKWLLIGIGSAGPDGDTSCTLFPDRDCQGARSPSISYPGVGDVGLFFQHSAWSFSCFKSSLTARDDTPLLESKGVVTGTPIDTTTLTVYSEATTPNPCLYITTESRFQGYGEKYCIPTATCGDFEPKWYSGKGIGSAGADGPSTCFLYTEPGCLGVRSPEIKYPGFNYVGNPWNATSRAFACYN